MAAKQEEYTTLQEEQADYPRQQQDSYPLQTRDKQPQQASYQPPQASYPPQQGSYPPQQGSYPPQQASDPPQQGSYPPPQASYPPPQASYPLQQAGYPPQQASYLPQQAGYPPQQGYPQPLPQRRQATTTDIIDQQPSLENTVVVTFGESPVRTVCPHCRVTVVSTTYKAPGFKTYVCCVLLSCIGCNAGCCLFPFCMGECLDVVHACPLCRNKIGVYQQEL